MCKHVLPFFLYSLLSEFRMRKQAKQEKWFTIYHHANRHASWDTEHNKLNLAEDLP